jgi:DNA-binding transcriptional ArsR family regulator
VKSKTEKPDSRLPSLADYAKALSHPVRIKILDILLEKKTCICGDIVELLPLAQSTVSQHLKALKKVGLIKGEIEGPKTCYCLDMEKFNHARMLFQNYFQQYMNLD